MTPKRVLITGATGRIGRFVVDALGSTHAFSILPVGSPRSTLPLTLDIADVDATAQLVASTKPDVIIHLAGVLPTSGADFSPNESSTRAIIDAAGSSGVSRIVLASSAAVYGDSRAGALRESLEPLPTGAYGESKVASERVLTAANCETVALRIFNVYGPGFADSLVERLLVSSEHSPVPIGDLDNFVRDYVHVKDVADAILAAATVELSDTHNTVNVGTGIPTNNRELVRILSARRGVHFSGGVGGESYNVADTRLASAVLGFAARRLLTDAP
jgi:UDP-glucose 4-epimerase